MRSSSSCRFLFRAGAFLASLALLFNCAFCEGFGLAGPGQPDIMEDVYALPIDFSGGCELDPRNFDGKTFYQDPTITVTLTSGRYSDCDWWAADIVIASPTQLRTVSSDGFDKADPRGIKGPRLAKAVNAVLAVDGDYFHYTGKGFILRQGILYKNILDGSTDVLLIDEDGDFHVIARARQGEVSETVNGKKVINAMYFGPALVIDGEPVRGVSGAGMAEDKGRQRMAICQVGPLHYKCICCAGPARGSSGMNLQVFTYFVADMGVKTAYNLDGGDSTMLIFNGEKINDIYNSSSRDLVDIVYFASAWDE